MDPRAGGLLLALVVCACSGGDQRASEDPDGPVAIRSLSDAQVASLVALINGTEIAAGKAVEPKLASPAARALARLLVADHTRLTETMPQFDGPRDSPPQAHTLRAVLHSHAAMLSTLPAGFAFDATFAATQVVDHATAIDSLLRWRESAQDPELRRALGATVPVMESHLAHARAVFAGLNQTAVATRLARPDTAAPDRRSRVRVGDPVTREPPARDSTEGGG